MAGYVHPSDCSIMEHFDRFSNVEEDKSGDKKVVGVRKQKLRGDFTPEEREQRRLAAMQIQAMNKAAKESQLSLF